MDNFLASPLSSPRGIFLERQSINVKGNYLKQSPVTAYRAGFSIRAANNSIEAQEHVRHMPLVKMCGIARAQDANSAAQAGADFVGMILWPKSKRSVLDLSLAREIAAAARQGGAEPVGVFVDEDAASIENTCDRVGLNIAQLHGDVSRASIDNLSSELRVIYVLHADKHGFIQTQLPSPQTLENIEWTLVDGLQGGSGEAFDWRNFSTPSHNTRKGWLLAGGLKPENVATAISLLKPTAVDVSSGIASKDGVTKDISRIQAFMRAVKNPERSNVTIV